MKLRAPLLNDVTTDLDDPPTYPSGRHGAYPEAFASLVREHYADLGPLRVARPADEVVDAARRLAEERRGWTVTRTGDHVIEAVAATRLLRFKDDVVIRVRADGDGAVVDLRSASRLGRGDFGVNAERIAGFLADLRSRLA